jgi:hypothetical protein
MVRRGTAKTPLQLPRELSDNLLSRRDASRQTLEGQTHDVNPNVIAPVIIDFFKN